MKSAQFQSVANSELWWSNLVHDGNRLGIVARHMSRRTRVPRKPSSVASDSSLHHQPPRRGAAPRVPGDGSASSRRPTT